MQLHLDEIAARITAKGPDGTMKGRQEPFSLRANYVVQWKDYSVISELPEAKFRYLLLTVAK